MKKIYKKSNKTNMILVACVILFFFFFKKGSAATYIPPKPKHLLPNEMEQICDDLFSSYGLFNDNESLFLDALRRISYKSDFDSVKLMMDLRLNNDYGGILLGITNYESLRERVIEGDDITVYNLILASYV